MPAIAPGGQTETYLDCDNDAFGAAVPVSVTDPSANVTAYEVVTEQNESNSRVTVEVGPDGLFVANQLGTWSVTVSCTGFDPFVSTFEVVDPALEHRPRHRPRLRLHHRRRRLPPRRRRAGLHHHHQQHRGGHPSASRPSPRTPARTTTPPPARSARARATSSAAGAGDSADFAGGSIDGPPGVGRARNRRIRRLRRELHPVARLRPARRPDRAHRHDRPDRGDGLRRRRRPRRSHRRPRHPGVPLLHDDQHVGRRVPLPRHRRQRPGHLYTGLENDVATFETMSWSPAQPDRGHRQPRPTRAPGRRPSTTPTATATFPTASSPSPTPPPRPRDPAPTPTPTPTPSRRRRPRHRSPVTYVIVTGEAAPAVAVTSTPHGRPTTIPSAGSRASRTDRSTRPPTGRSGPGAHRPLVRTAALPHRRGAGCAPGFASRRPGSAPCRVTRASEPSASDTRAR